jgi:hypothetical protein
MKILSMYVRTLGRANADGLISSALAGAVIWLIVVAWLHPSPFETGWAVSLLLLSPLVLVPLGLRLAAPSEQEQSRSWLWLAAFRLQLPAALVLVAAFAISAGLMAAVLSLPWLLTTSIISLTGLARIRRRGLSPIEELCLDAGLVYLVVGGVWTVMSRWGLRPLNFEAIIVLLTAIHFHFAGFALPILTGLAGRALKGEMARTASVGVIVGIPMVAVGITTTQLGFRPLLECLAAILTAIAGLLSAGLHLRLFAQSSWPKLVRALWLIAALSLAASMILAAIYGSRAYLSVAWLDIPWMRALHGSANALGFALLGTLAWSLAHRSSPPRS